MAKGVRLPRRLSRMEWFGILTIAAFIIGTVFALAT
jgi:hypothetical protein